ncbi:hypothetical protein [Herbiconiux sp. UC225_62]|uniref:hypothetical protein n=1 Tax=Herbiconiux sp. UC225_62 TaxID=3350168 RepID=UPI0036D2E26B
MKMFVAAHGQADNVGDSVLRRGMMASLATGRDRYVLVGRAGPDYVSGLGLRSTDTVFTSRRKWQLAALAAGLRERVAFFSNAGEMQVNRRRILIGLVDTILLAVIRLRGGVAVHTGVGVRNPQGRWPAPIAIPARLCSLVAWRDAPTRDKIGFGSVYPDWAFVEGSVPVESEIQFSARDIMVVSLRGDRPIPDAVWIDSVKEFSRMHDLQIVVANQVARDAHRAIELADLLGGRTDLWEGGAHDLRENEMRSLYRRAQAVVSDRLHALIMGLTEGAVPLGLMPGSTAKVDRTFEAGGFSDSALSSSDHTLSECVEWLVERMSKRDAIFAQVAGARRSIADLTQRVRTLVPASATVPLAASGAEK